MMKWSETKRDGIRQLASKSSTASSGRGMRSYQTCGKAMTFMFVPQDTSVICTATVDTSCMLVYDILVTLKLESLKVRWLSLLGSQVRFSSRR